MKRWLAVLIIALILGTLGVTLHQNYLEAIGFVLIILSLAAFIWSWVRLSFELRPRPRRRLRRVDRLVKTDGVRKSRTEALHDVIFRRNPRAE
jgi:protein-S-isoprenylcysteine O-methyltransferase Ste14